MNRGRMPLAVSQAAQPETVEALCQGTSQMHATVSLPVGDLDLRLFAWLCLFVTLSASFCKQHTYLPSAI